MAHFGILAPPLHGHLNPLLALATTLTGRGHAVTFFNIADVEGKIRTAGHAVHVIGRHAYPPGWLAALQATTGQLKSLAAMMHWNAESVRQAATLGDEYAAALAAGLDCLLVDQLDVLGATLAEHLGLPFVTVCTTLITNWEENIPPSFVAGSYAATPADRVGHRAQFATIQQSFAPVTTFLQQVRARWGLPAFRSPDNYFPQSELATLAQQPAAFDFPRQALPATFHYVGPLRQPLPTAEADDFPYERLSGQPLVYASLGTLVNNNLALFTAIAAACAPLDVQLVLAIGPGNDLRQFQNLPGAPLVVQFAPQQALLRRAALAITHAGLNTVLDCVLHGVPMVAIPVSFDQPGIAARISWTRIGEVVPLRQAGEARIRRAVQALLADDGYRQRVCQMQAPLTLQDGTTHAATLLEALLENLASAPPAAGYGPRATVAGRAVLQGK